MSDKLDTLFVWVLGVLLFIAIVFLHNCSVSGDEWQFDVVQPQQVTEPTTDTASEFYVVMFSADYCGYCQTDKKRLLPLLKKAMPLSGVIDVVADPSCTKRQFINFRGKDQFHSGVSSLPTYWLIERKHNGKRVIIEEWVGRPNLQTILDKLPKVESNTPTPIVKPKPVVSVKPEISSNIYNGQPGNSHYNRTSLINHLMYEGIHRGRHSLSQLNSMTDSQLNSLHSSDHN